MGAIGIFNGVPVGQEALRGELVPVIADAQIPNRSHASLGPAPEGPVVVFNRSGDDMHVGVNDTGQHRRVAGQIHHFICSVKAADTGNDAILHQNVYGLTAEDICLL